MAISDRNLAAYGLSSLEAELRERRIARASNPNPLEDHPAVTSYRETGVKTDDLVSFIESFASLRASRVKNMGHSQYAHAQGQKFETFGARDTIKELIEELADAGNYIDFLAVKLLNLAATMEQSELPID